MADFVNLYEELGLDHALECSQIEQELKKLRKKWRMRQHARQIELSQYAALKSKYVEEAQEILTDESKRKEYDDQLSLIKLGNIIC